MNTTGAIRRMIAAGLTMDQALIAADAFAAEAKAEAEQKVAEKRAVNADRQRRFRETRNANNALQPLHSVTSVTQAATYTEDAPTHAEPEPNITTTPPTSEAKASSVGAPSAVLPLTGELLLPSPSQTHVKPKSRASPERRGSRLPADWVPDEDDFQIARNEGIPDERIPRIAAEYRDYWSDVPGERGRKLSWKGTWRNHCRRVADRFGGSRQAYAAGNQRSDGSLLAAHQRAAARARAANDVPRQRASVFDHRERELEMHYGIPAE